LDVGEVTIDLGRLAFREIELAEGDAFALRVNGEPVFCRGACWTTTDVVTLVGDEAAYRALLEMARDAGMNMLRIAGTNAYESDAFYDICDELGILVWQDFMFANMDYPTSDAFLDSVRREVNHFVSRTQTRACLAVLCGSSEVEQQVAMLGLPRELWSIPLFREHIPALCRERRPDVPYVPSSPSGGALPFHVNAGAAHYYGVGAYLRPLEDARRAEVRFASECLAFANIPEDATLESFIGAGVMTPQNVRWKERAPRDSGGSWDFDDVRDHYLERLFDVDARDLRTTDLERYLTLGRMVTGEVMASVFGEWRRARSTCRGGIVFAFQDFWAGAGFGVIDALGRPKAAYYYLKRALSSLALSASDEGSNGVVLHAINETDQAVAAVLTVDLYRHGHVSVVALTRPWALQPRGVHELALDRELEHFVDTAYSYRFGPPSYDVLVASLRAEGAAHPIAEAYFFPSGPALPRHVDIGLSGVARKMADGRYEVDVSTTQFAQSVVIDAGPYVADQNWFHLAPGATRTLRLRSAQPAAPWSATLKAANAYSVARVAAPILLPPPAPAELP
jgi:beta-mannosidase